MTTVSTLNGSNIMNWDKTPNFYKGMWAFRNNINKMCGDDVLGYGRGCGERAVDNVISFLKRSINMSCFKNVETGVIITKSPTFNDLVDNLTYICEKAPLYYTKFPKTYVKDEWENKHMKIKKIAPLDKNIQSHARLLKYGGKRFTAIDKTIKEQVTDLVLNSKGILSEFYVVSFLNSNIKCPECKVNGKFGLCDNVQINCSNSFRDVICMNCYNNKVITLFEIKTRWDNTVSNKNYVDSGSFIALNVLFAIKAHVYVVIASRDTGDVRIGKITRSKPRSNKNWLYSLQENLGWGGPSSISICENGIYKLSYKMKPPLNKVLTNKMCNKIYKTVLDKVIKCTHCDSKDIDYCYSRFSENLIPICKECVSFECCTICGWESGENVCNMCSSGL